MSHLKAVIFFASCQITIKRREIRTHQLDKTRAGTSPTSFPGSSLGTRLGLHVIIVTSSFSKLSSVFKMFSIHAYEHEKPALSNSAGLKSVFQRFRFRDGLVWTVGLTVEITLRLQIPSVDEAQGFQLGFSQFLQLQRMQEKEISPQTFIGRPLLLTYKLHVPYQLLFNPGCSLSFSVRNPICLFWFVLLSVLLCLFISFKRVNLILLFLWFGDGKLY